MKDNRLGRLKGRANARTINDKINIGVIIKQPHEQPQMGHQGIFHCQSIPLLDLVIERHCLGAVGFRSPMYLKIDQKSAKECMGTHITQGAALK